MDNLLFVSDFYDIQLKKDSGTPALRLIVETLAKKYQVHIIAPDGSGQDKENITYHRIHVPALPGSSRLSCAINSKLFWYFFTKAAIERGWFLNKKHRFKLVYGAGCSSVYAASTIGKDLCIPSVGRLFGTYLYPYLNYPGSLFLRFEECMAFKSNLSKLIVTNDGTDGDRVAKHFNVPKDRLCFWRNGVNEPLHICMKPTDAIHIVSMARLDRWKRVDRIIKAVAEVRKQRSDIVLDVVGDGPEMQTLKELVDQIGIKHVFFHGMVTRKEASCLLTSADIFITTNDYSNVSNSLLEAMMCGKVVIALNTGGTSDIIQDGINGFLVDKEEELSNAIRRACDKNNRMRIGYEAREYAREHFELWDSRIQKEVAVCEELIGGRT